VRPSVGAVLVTAAMLAMPLTPAHSAASSVTAVSGSGYYEEIDYSGTLREGSSDGDAAWWVNSFALAGASPA